MRDFKGYSITVKMVDGRAVVLVVVDSKEYVIDAIEGFATPDDVSVQDVSADLQRVVNHLPGVARLIMAIAQDFPAMKAGGN